MRVLTNYGELDVVIDEATGRARNGKVGVVGTRDKVRRVIGPLEPVHNTGKRTILTEHCEALSKRTRGTAGSNPAPSLSFASKTESAYAQYLDALKYGNELVNWWYQPFRLYLPGGVTYRPDFMVQYPHGVALHETKGWSKNLRDGMTRFKLATAIFPCFAWYLVRKGKGGSWDIKIYP